MKHKQIVFLTTFYLHNFLGHYGHAYINTAYNPAYPFTYSVPDAISLILGNKNINKSEAIYNSPYAGIQRVKIGDYYYHTAKQCGTHFLNAREGFILSDKMFGAGAQQRERCIWGFVGNQFCTPSIICPKFKPRGRSSDCRTNYLQFTDSGESFAMHFCDRRRTPRIDTEYTSKNGLLDVFFKYTNPRKRPEFECLVRCVNYQVNFTLSDTNENKTQVQVASHEVKELETNLPDLKESQSCKCGISPNEKLSPLFKSAQSSQVLESENSIENTTVKLSTEELFSAPSLRKGKILGGREPAIGQYPWMAGLVARDGFLPFCGASIINDRYVLTAQHCLNDEEVGDFVVVLNEHDFLNESETVGGTVRKEVIEFIPYHHYLESVFDGDVALLALKTPIKIHSSQFTPICLPKNKTNSFVDYDVIGAGWGTLNETSDKSPLLLEVLLKVMSNAACNDYHSSQPPVPLQVSERMLCSGYAEGGRDTCSGDSGGPLMAYDNSRFTQVGVTSWGFGCGNPLNPGVFARVTEFMTWIKMHTLDGTYCS